MFYLVDVTSGWTSAWLFVVGGALLVLVLFFPLGIMGAVRARLAPVAAVSAPRHWLAVHLRKRRIHLVRDVAAVSAPPAVGRCIRTGIW